MTSHIARVLRNATAQVLKAALACLAVAPLAFSQVACAGEKTAAGEAAAIVGAELTVNIAPGVVLATANMERARGILVTRDDFVAAMSPFDRQSRVGVAEPVSEDAYLAFAAEHAAAWTDAELQRFEAGARRAAKVLAPYALPLPETVWVVKTTGQEESGAAYTRGESICLPATMLGNPDGIPQLIVHELFHVASRYDAAWRERVYATIGFEPCSDIAYPDAIADKRITNPDGYRNDYTIGVTVDGDACRVIPVIFANREYDPDKARMFFAYLDFQFMKVAQSGSNCSPVLDGDAPVLYQVAKLEGFFEQIGRNTQYIIHPDEILAENLVKLVFEADVQSPDVIERLSAAVRRP